ncbi:unnamed protein product [Cylindrotheca closterium]|uniref:Galactose oxidase n=1 Tax=Cylindrotheca closterium TaxID=2856 RepID=A0AAD2CVZ8_9STRA|nr:unnamed protein product [Cylindrotheca closterium]
MMTSAPKVTWTKVTPAPDPTHGSPIPRSSHGLSIVQNGTRLILLGGEHVARTPIDVSNSHWAADLMDDGKWQWRLLSPAATGPTDRIAHAQAVHKDSFVYIFGGRAGITMQEKAMSDLWKLDVSAAPGTETWSQVEATNEGPEARSFHRMICIGDFLYMFGGCTPTGRENDLWRFDVLAKKWENLGRSALLRGRGGPNLVPLASGSLMGVVAGFAGEETADGHAFHIANKKWENSGLELEGMRPRSVCVAASFPSVGKSIVFGGEVDPSDRGHMGAGGFENDIVILDEATGKYETTIAGGTSSDWPATRGWSDASSCDNGKGLGQVFVFGGLSGDDKNPTRLDDLWILQVEK